MGNNHVSASKAGAVVVSCAAAAAAVYTTSSLLRMRSPGKEKGGIRPRPRQIHVSVGPEGWKATEPVGMSEEDKKAERMKLKLLLKEPTGSGRFALKLVLKPHTRYPDHWHGSAEWCFVVKGSISDEYGEKKAGDFFYNEIGSSHRNIIAGADGCELWVVKDKGDNPPIKQGETCCPLLSTLQE
uniref:ChrR-like cupin domain-containing protein n=1 Tax=Lotharella oceanica TaxID=641309 RepID=A0A7S2TES0_9EUKA|mmetsp:Transcript_10650/g.20414  ORF Transcript_10650/g.20414 Transcript_10650/m.20414 type:complete len:184 (+) Transcript_10650:77-628(+)